MKHEEKSIKKKSQFVAMSSLPTYIQAYNACACIQGKKKMSLPVPPVLVLLSRILAFANHNFFFFWSQRDVISSNSI